MKATNLHSETVLRDLLAGSGIPALARLVVPVTSRPDRAPWELLPCSQDPRERLTECLDVWAIMDESTWPEANVKALYEDIMDLFKAYPEAEAWYREWRKAHAEARLC